MTITLSRQESADAYGGVVARLNDRWRVIVCRDGLQWILQFIKFRRAGVAWEGRSYFRTRDGLLRFLPGLAGQIEASALAILQALPARIEESQP